MQVKIEHNCFTNKANYRDLDAIFSLFIEGQHKWIDIDLEEIENTDWFKNLGNRNTEDLKTMFVSSTRKSNSKKTVAVHNESQNEFNVFEAKFYLKQSLTIIVENYEYEPIFINKIIEKFDSSNELIDAKNIQWLVYENGGGSNDNTVKGKLKESFNNQKLTKAKYNYLRCFVIKDSDREYCIINADGNITQQKLPKNKTKFLEENKIPFHIFYKREKENYLPDKIYDSFLKIANKKDKKKKFSQAYLGLTHSQKDFLNIEKGFSQKAKKGREIIDRKNLKPEIETLYKSLSDIEYRTIGLGIEYPNFKSEFSNNFKDVNKEDLGKRIKHQPLLTSKVNLKDTTERNEFEHIINEIKYLL
ncbi:MAG: hypothetical protein ACPGTO_06425 [Polaribacter sp.]